MIKELQLNKIPIRTSNNFGMNEIVLKNIDIPEKIDSFENINIRNEDMAEIYINDCKSPDEESLKIKYGVGKELLNEVYKFANHRIFIHITKRLTKPIVIEYNFDKSNKNLVDDIKIEAEENTEAQILIKYTSKEEGNFYHNGLIRTNAKKGSNIKIGVVNLLNKDSYNFTSYDNTLEDNAKIKYTLIELGGKNIISNWYSSALGEAANCKLEGIYLGIDNQLIDLNYIGELYGTKSEIHIDIQGVLKDEAVKNFKGIIDFKTGAKEAKGTENESCILLSDKARAKALPILLCTEDDVEGEHSTGSGKIENEKLFYIMSRGFSKKEAIKMIVKSKFDYILQDIDENNDILQEIDNRLE